MPTQNRRVAIIAVAALAGVALLAVIAIPRRGVEKPDRSVRPPVPVETRVEATPEPAPGPTPGAKATPAPSLTAALAAPKPTRTMKSSTGKGKESPGAISPKPVMGGGYDPASGFRPPPGMGGPPRTPTGAKATSVPANNAPATGASSPATPTQSAAALNDTRGSGSGGTLPGPTATPRATTPAAQPTATALPTSTPRETGAATPTPEPTATEEPTETEEETETPTPTPSATPTEEPSPSESPTPTRIPNAYQFAAKQGTVDASTAQAFVAMTFLQSPPWPVGLISLRVSYNRNQLRFTGATFTASGIIPPFDAVENPLGWVNVTMASAGPGQQPVGTGNLVRLDFDRVGEVLDHTVTLMPGVDGIADTTLANDLTQYSNFSGFTWRGIATPTPHPTITVTATVPPETATPTAAPTAAPTRTSAY